MQKLLRFAALFLSSLGLCGCQASCGESTEPVLWTDGIITPSGVYLSTAIDDKWLHFPSHRSFRLRHNFGTKNVHFDAYVSFEEQPLNHGESQIPSDFAVASGNILVETETNENDIVVKNDTCENDYYMLVQIENLDAK
jgi:hypothetical protein